MALRDEILAKASPQAIADADEAAIVAAVNAGRVRTVERTVSERGVMAALGIVDGEVFLAALEAFAASTLAAEHPLYAAHPGIKRAIGWLKGDGINVGDPLTRDLLDALASTGVLNPSSVSAIKALAEIAHPVDPMDVRRALWADDGSKLL